MSSACIAQLPVSPNRLHRSQRICSQPSVCSTSGLWCGSAACPRVAHLLLRAHLVGMAPSAATGSAAGATKRKLRRWSLRWWLGTLSQIRRVCLLDCRDGMADAIVALAEAATAQVAIASGLR